MEHATGSTSAPEPNGYTARSSYALDLGNNRLRASLSSLDFATEVVVDKLTAETIQVSHTSRISGQPETYCHVFVRFEPDPAWLERGIVPVLDKDKPGAARKGYHWVVRSPELRSLFFHYDTDSRTQCVVVEPISPYFFIFVPCARFFKEALNKKPDDPY